jgi:hypothetical protein
MDRTRFLPQEDLETEDELVLQDGWRASMNNHEYLRRSFDPTTAADVATNPNDLRGFAQPGIMAIENLYNQMRGELPLEWLVTVDPQDYKFLGSALTPEVASQLRDAHLYADMYQERERQLQEQVENIMWRQYRDVDDPRYPVEDTLLYGGAGASGAAVMGSPSSRPNVGARIMAELRGLSSYAETADYVATLLRESQREPFFNLVLAATDYRRGLIEAGATEAEADQKATYLFEDWADKIESGEWTPEEALKRHRGRWGASDALGKGLGNLFGTLMGVAGNTADLIQAVMTDDQKELSMGIAATSMGILGWDVSQQQLEERRKELLDEMNFDDSQLYRQFAFGQIDQQWELFKRQETEEYDILLRAANGDENLAFGLFAMGVESSMDESPGETVSKLRAELNEQVNQLDQDEYTMSDTVLDMMAAYGKIPMGIATGIVAMFNEEDRDRVFGGIMPDLQELWATVQDYDYLPSAALGVEGSLMGLTADLVLPMPFDPFVWLVAPAGTGGYRNATQAQMVANSRVGRAFMDDLVRAHYSPSKGAFSEHLISGGVFDDVGLAGELDAWLGRGNPNTIPDTAWRKGKYATTTDELNIEWALGLLDEPQRGSYAALKEEAREALKNQLSRDGSPTIRVTLDSVSGQMAIEAGDDVKRLLALEDMGQPMVPVTVKISEGFPTKVTPQYTAPYDTLHAAQAWDIAGHGRFAKPRFVKLFEVARNIPDPEAGARLLELALLRGAQFEALSYGALRRAFTDVAEFAMRDGPVSDWFHHITDKFWSGDVFPTRGPGAMRDLNQLVASVWRKDPIKGDLYVQAIREWQQGIHKMFDAAEGTMDAHAATVAAMENLRERLSIPAPSFGEQVAQRPVAQAAAGLAQELRDSPPGTFYFHGTTEEAAAFLSNAKSGFEGGITTTPARSTQYTELVSRLLDEPSGSLIVFRAEDLLHESSQTLAAAGPQRTFGVLPADQPDVAWGAFKSGVEYTKGGHVTPGPGSGVFLDRLANYEDFKQHIDHMLANFPEVRSAVDIQFRTGDVVPLMELVKDSLESIVERRTRREVTWSELKAGLDEIRATYPDRPPPDWDQPVNPYAQAIGIKQYEYLDNFELRRPAANVESPQMMGSHFNNVYDLLPPDAFSAAELVGRGLDVERAVTQATPIFEFTGKELAELKSRLDEAYRTAGREPGDAFYPPGSSAVPPETQLGIVADYLDELAASEKDNLGIITRNKTAAEVYGPTGPPPGVSSKLMESLPEDSPLRSKTFESDLYRILEDEGIPEELIADTRETIAMWKSEQAQWALAEGDWDIGLTPEERAAELPLQQLSENLYIFNVAEEIMQTADVHVPPSAFMSKLSREMYGTISRQRMVKLPLLEEITSYNSKVSALGRQANKLRGQLDSMLPGPEEWLKLQGIVTEAFEDFNRTVLANLKPWSKFVDPETGLVPWPVFQRGVRAWEKMSPSQRLDAIAEHADDLRNILPQAHANMIARAMGVTPEIAESLAREMNPSWYHLGSVRTPISQMDMMAATTLSTRKHQTYLKYATYRGLRDSANVLRSMFILDKIARVSTFITVASDELLTHFRRFGIMQGFGGYTTDAIARPYAWAASKLDMNLPFSKLAQETLDAHRDAPVLYSQLATGASETSHTNWIPVGRNDLNFLPAARAWTGGWMSDTNVANFLTMTKDEYRKWWTTSPESANSVLWKEAVVVPLDGTPRKVTFDDHYEVMGNLFSLYLAPALRGSKVAEARELWASTIRKSQELGAPQNLPDAFLKESFVEVMGNMGANNPQFFQRGLDRFMHAGMVRPQQATRRSIATSKGISERARLEELFASQNKRIVPDSEVADLLGKGTMAGSPYIQATGWLNELAMRQGYVTESYVNSLVNEAIRREIDHSTFLFHMGSVGGRRVAKSGDVPFFRPYAEMWARWGREMLSRPEPKPWVTNLLGEHVGHAIRSIPINPRPIGTLSRLANVDFQIGNVDLGSWFFVPTAGENPIYTTMPGLGFFPLFGADTAFAMMPDNTADDWKEFLGQYIQGLDWVKDTGDVGSTFAQRLFRGGQMSELLITGLSLYEAMVGQGPSAAISSFLGDPYIELRYNRLVRVEGAEHMQDLLSETDVDMLKAEMDHLATNARKTGALQTAGTKGTRFMFPARANFDTSTDELLDLWYEADEKIPWDWLDVDVPDFRADEQTIAHARREKFFNLPQWQRNLILSKSVYPELAVNLVSSWEWSDRGRFVLGEESDIPFRLDGTDETFELFEDYKERKMLVPIPHGTVLARAVGLATDSTEKVVKEMYTFQAEMMNDIFWEGPPGGVLTEPFVREMISSYGGAWEDDNQAAAFLKNFVTADIKVELEDMAANYDFPKEYGLETAKDIWIWWSTVREDARDERWAEQLEQLGIDPARVKELDRIIPTSQMAWSTTYPGDDPENASARWKSLGIPVFAEETKIIADALGIDLTEGMTGEQLLAGINEVTTSFDSAARAWALPLYQAYTAGRAEPSNLAKADLSSLGDNLSIDREVRDEIGKFMFYVDRKAEKKRELGVLSAWDEQQVRNRYNALSYLFDDQYDNIVFDWDSTWDRAYRTTFGDRWWEPPQPREPFREDGSKRAGVWTPSYVEVVDGDSLIVKGGQGGTHYVRLLGVFAGEWTSPTGPAETAILEAFVQRALMEGDQLYLVRDPDITRGRDVDAYGRELAWLWAGDLAFNRPSTLRATDR